MPTVSSAEFVRNFGTYQRTAQREPVAVTSYGKVAGYYISSRDAELLERAKAARQAYHPDEVPSEIAADIRGAVPDLAATFLDHLMEE